MNKFYNKKKWLQQLSQVQLAKQVALKLERKILYPECCEEPDIWYTHTTEDHRGSKRILTLLNRPGKRNDSYFIAVDGIQLYYNKYGNLVMNQTRWPLILGFSDSMRFWAKQFPRISSTKRIE